MSGSSLPTGPARDARRARTETAVGLVVLAAIAGLLALALGGSFGAPSGTPFRASFARVDGLAVGSDVRIAGVPVGHVTSLSIDPRSFLATVGFRIRDGIALPDDTSASIESEGLLGGDYVSISPGGDPRNLPPGGLITATQSTVGLETLLGQFVSSVTGLMDAVKKSNAIRAGAIAGPAPPGGTAAAKPAAAPFGGSLGP